MQTNEKMVRSVGLRAKDIVLAVARSCEGAQTEMEAPLESDLKQLTEYDNIQHSMHLNTDYSWEQNNVRDSGIYARASCS